ncbi:hypothetical protein HMPREF1869_00280 [Bacteroidales bacterium KA00251]|nr:hypothetical protein HMPREF1869_00280 [Bacteroidales bacterium KA00251]
MRIVLFKFVNIEAIPPCEERSDLLDLWRKFATMKRRLLHKVNSLKRGILSR